MAHRITAVVKGSPAYRAGIRAGDELLSIGGETIIDFIDYQALTVPGRLTVKTRKGEYHIKKAEYADLGLEFSTGMMSGVRMCCNKCMFCFVDQLPCYARESLRVKDDDWRMSLMMGNYVTMTNVSDRELERIVRRHVSPLYISVHCMDPELRVKLMGTPRARRLPEQLRKLAEGGVHFHCQAVLCPNLNDGAQLERTISELTDLYPAAQSLALVPVGLTGHREGLSSLRKYRPEEARAVLEIAEKWRKTCLEKFGTRFVFPSDEFYLAANAELPDDEAYEDYAQIDDGVGMLRLFDTEYREAWEERIAPVPAETQTETKIRPLIACGVSAAPFFESLLRRRPIPGADIRVKAIVNHFFGPEVTVSGLITGKDLVEQTRDVDCTHVLISECTLRPEDSVFLDDMSLEQVQTALGRPVIPVGRRGGDIIETVFKLMEEQ